MKSGLNSDFKGTTQGAREQLATKHAAAVARDGIDSLHQGRARSLYMTRLAVKTGDRVVILKTDAIDAIESAGKYVAVRDFDPPTALATIARERLSALYLVPTAYYTLLCDAAADAADLSSVRKLGYAGSQRLDTNIFGSKRSRVK